MSYLVLARKYRPQNFEQVVQQAHVTQTLANAVSSGRVAHAILFSGPRGTGKTTIARVMAKAMNCKKGPTPVPCNVCQSCSDITAGSSADVFEIDGASNNSVDQVRELRDNVKYLPAYSLHKIYIIDEVHMLSVAAFNALLKTLEEPPSHILFFFATTEPHKIPVTILSRCQRYDLRRIGADAIMAHLKDICGREDTQIPEESLRLISREAGGAMRDAMSLLDQVFACSQGEISHAKVLEILGVFDTPQLFSISEAVFNANVQKLLSIVQKMYDSGRDLKKLYHDLVLHFRNLLVVKTAKNAAGLVDMQPAEIDLAAQQVADVPDTTLHQLFDRLTGEETAIRYALQPRLAMEMTLIRLARVKPALPIETLIERLDGLRKDLLTKPVIAGPAPNTLHDTRSRFGTADLDTPGPPGTQGSTGEAPVAAKPPEPASVAPREHGAAEKSLPDIWAELTALIAEKQPSLAANLAKSALKQLDETGLEIEVNGSQFNLNMVKKAKNISGLKKVCRDYFGKPMAIRVIAKTDSPKPGRTANEKVNERKSAAMGHPVVADAIELFNGTVVDVKLE
ncbi:MAG: DNA polymerase III subunit gamma/tau [Deltaproteobacteria bacterium]|nr:DNA polymerase III subunit gamma/tau [Deltaproteobacteria bacterium]